MRIKEITSQHRCGSYAFYECEHCGGTRMDCKACNKTAAGNYPTTRDEIPRRTPTPYQGPSLSRR